MRKDREEAGEPSCKDGGSPQSLQEGTPPLGIATLKDFLRYYALGSNGALDRRMTAESLNSQAERFFAGFTRVTGSIVTEEDRSHIYNVRAAHYTR